MAVQRSLLVVRETRQIFWAGAAGSVGNVLLLLVLAPRWHVPGIALATTLTHVVSLVMAGAFAHRRWNER